MKEPSRIPVLEEIERERDDALPAESLERAEAKAIQRLRTENADLQRRNVQLMETFLYFQERLDELQNQLAAAQVEKAKVETTLEEELQLREKLEQESQNLRKRLTKAVEVIALERGKSPLKKLLGK
jgi:predicted ribosome quality control (RQC) complex YloA/Tae2 family protein